MPEFGKYTKELKKLISEAGHILLICHINPDGDAIGAMLAMRRWIMSQGKDATMISPNALQKFLLWMKDVDKVLDFHHNPGEGGRLINEADLIIMVDFNTTSRMGKAEQLVISSDARKVMIDHHPDPGTFADLIISDVSRSSTSELVYFLVNGMEGTEFSDSDFITAVYVGIITDTGNFEHGYYTGDTMRTVGHLLDMGVDKERIHDHIFSNFSADRIRLKGFALHSRMVVHPELHTAYIWLTKEDLERFRHMKGDTEGFANVLLTMQGIVLSVLFVERTGFVKMSLRSKGSFNANELSRKCFNGGGHLNAAGGEMKGTIHEVVNHFENTLPSFSRELEEAAKEMMR
ncbi:MAG: bifunctional oligoribonuclease/PAP phosphatase NrnA [Bacteroidales bacterium]|nr:bifunctional oligoribonuclease/PAP phosphatase NrnA [Bacteroidales bacterium]